MAHALLVSEIFSSVQGEGSNVGVPCTFLRLGNCNLRCSFCDTRYSWDWSEFDQRKELGSRDVAELARELRPARHLVITGGEPLLQQDALVPLLSGIAPSTFVEVETNGTLEPRPELFERVTQWNVSPKLANAGEPEARRLRFDVLEVFARRPNAWLKLVVENDARVQEARALAERLGWDKSRVMLMPEAQTPAQLDATEERIIAASGALGFRYSPRLHVRLWGARRGL